MTVAPPVQEMVDRLAQGRPRLCRLVEGLPAPVVEAVVLAMRSLIGRHDVRIQRPGLVEPPECAVDGCIANMVEAVFAQPPNDVVAVAIRVGQHGEHGQVEHALQQLGGIDFRLAHWTAWYYGLRSSATTDGAMARWACSARLSKLWTELIWHARSGRFIHPYPPHRMDLGPVFGGSALVQDAMQAVGIDDVRSGHRDLFSRRGRRRVIEATGVGVVGAEQNALWMLGNDLHHQVWAGLSSTCLELVRGLE